MFPQAKILHVADILFVRIEDVLNINTFSDHSTQHLSHENAVLLKITKGLIGIKQNINDGCDRFRGCKSSNPIVLLLSEIGAVHHKKNRG